MVLFWYNKICIFFILCNCIHGRILVKESSNHIRDNELKTPFTLEEFFDGTFSASTWNGTWLTDNTFLYKNTNGDFMEFDLSTKTSKLFLNGSILDKYPGASTSLSPDNTYVLIRYNVSSVFRHSTTAVYAIYDITTGEYYDINNKIAVQLAVFDTTGHGFAYVYKNNIYYLANVLDPNPVQVTTDGIEGVIYNGVPDWVYEEEVLGSGSALWFSPDGNNLAYAKFNDTNVKEFSYFLYGTPGDLADQYPTLAKIKYPKAGTSNPVVNTYVYNLNTLTTTQFELIDSIKNSEEDNDYVLYDLTWVSNSEVAMISSNRIQNETVIIRCSLDGSCKENSEEDNDYVLYDLTWVSNSEVAMISSNRIQNETVIIRCSLDGSCKENSEEDNDYVLYDLTWVSNSEVAMISSNRIQNETVIIRCSLDGSCKEEASHQQENGWLEPAIPNYSEDGTKRIEILPQPHEDDFFFHLVLTDVSTNTPKRLTYGNRVVTYFYGWDETNNLVYYAGSVNDTPSQQQIYVVDTETTENKCLTCDFVVDGENCKYGGASFSKKFSHYIKVCNGPNPAYTVIQNLQNETDTFIWNENAAVREELSKKMRLGKLDLTVAVKDNFTARVRLLLPPDLDYNKKYPAVVNVYGGPNSNQINDAFASGVLNYFVTNRSYIYILIDGRGSGRDGLNKMFQIYRQMGTVEIEDQIFVTKYLQDTFPFIDRNNTGIWGWSYGGFASTWALVQDTDDVFKFALSVAPVTNFIYYDTIYTERYMGLPTEEDNLFGYNNTDIASRVEDIRGKLYFVIHGSGDDNVHYQQTMLLVKALEEADIGFSQQTYPDENHGIGGLTRHLYHTIDNYWARAFGIQGPPISTW